MGTRGLNGFYYDGRMLTSYNQFDTYPDGLGVQVFTWTQQNLIDGKDGCQLNVEILGVLERLVLVEQTESPTPEQVELLTAKGITPAGVSTGRDWYAWLREGHGDVDWLMRSGFWPDSTDFGQDSLFCEWAWIVNADDRTLDCYQGFQKKPATEGFWATEDQASDQSGYFAIQRFWALPFNELAAMDAGAFVAEAERRSGHDE